jgi:hypothetical protein
MHRIVVAVAGGWWPARCGRSARAPPRLPVFPATPDRQSPVGNARRSIPAPVAPSGNVKRKPGGDGTAPVSSWHSPTVSREEERCSERSLPPSPDSINPTDSVDGVAFPVLSSRARPESPPCSGLAPTFHTVPATNRAENHHTSANRILAAYDSRAPMDAYSGAHSSPGASFFFPRRLRW